MTSCSALKSLKKEALKTHSLMLPAVEEMLRLQTKKKPGSLTPRARSQLILDIFAETWTYAGLTSHINKTAEATGYTRLSTIHKSTVNTILDEADIKPHKITYYCENRDPDFDSKMHNVLLVYKRLEMQFNESGELIVSDDSPVHVLSYDEKPGIQAVATTSDDLMPDERHQAISRDYEYKRLGTLSLLGAIDLQTGEAIPLVRDRHSKEGIHRIFKAVRRQVPKGRQNPHSTR